MIRSINVEGYVRSHHVGLVALMDALGGTSYAAVNLPSLSVGTLRRHLGGHRAMSESCSSPRPSQGLDGASTHVIHESVAQIGSAFIGGYFSFHIRADRGSGAAGYRLLSRRLGARSTAATGVYWNGHCSNDAAALQSRQRALRQRRVRTRHTRRVGSNAVHVLTRTDSS